MRRGRIDTNWQGRIWRTPLHARRLVTPPLVPGRREDTDIKQTKEDGLGIVALHGNCTAAAAAAAAVERRLVALIKPQMCASSDQLQDEFITEQTKP